VQVDLGDAARLLDGLMARSGLAPRRLRRHASFGHRRLRGGL